MNKVLKNIVFHDQNEDNFINDLITMTAEIHCNGEVKQFKENIPISVLDDEDFNTEKFSIYIWEIVDRKYETKQLNN
jgi:hypothetical protein